MDQFLLPGILICVDNLAFMSNPLSRFQSLDLNDMAETRSQRRRQQQRAGSTGRGRGRATVSSQPQHFVPSSLGHSGIQYFIQRLSPDSSRRAAEGLGSDFFVDHLRSHGTSHGTYYAFQLKKPISVRIHDPVSGTNRIDCSCGGQAPCVHIYVGHPLKKTSASY